MRDIQRDVEFEDIVKKLAEQKHPHLAASLFRTMRELLCFCAVVGFNNGVRRPLGKKTETIPSRVFENNDMAIDLIYLLALSETKTAEVLKPERENEAVQIFEEYASGGLECVKSWLAKTPTDPYGDTAIINGLREAGAMEPGREEDGEPIAIEI